MHMSDEMTPKSDEDELPPQPEGWVLDSLDKLEWALAKLGALRAMAPSIKARAAELIARAEKEADRFEEWLTPQAEQWYADNPPRRGKSIKTLGGTIGYRRTGGGPRIVNQEALVAWAEERAPEMVTTVTKKQVYADEVKAHIDDTGEVPDGVELTEPVERFYAKGVVK